MKNKTENKKQEKIVVSFSVLTTEFGREKKKAVNKIWEALTKAEYNRPKGARTGKSMVMKAYAEADSETQAKIKTILERN